MEGKTRSTRCVESLVLRYTEKFDTISNIDMSIPRYVEKLETISNTDKLMLRYTWYRHFDTMSNTDISMYRNFRYDTQH